MKNKDLNKLGFDKLDKVNGGTTGQVNGMPSDAQLISDYAENYVGKEVYIQNKEHDNHYYWGTLVASYEEEKCGNRTERVHVVNIIGKTQYATELNCGSNKVYADDYRIYLKNNMYATEI